MAPRTKERPEHFGLVLLVFGGACAAIGVLRTWDDYARLLLVTGGLALVVAFLMLVVPRPPDTGDETE